MIIQRYTLFIPVLFFLSLLGSGGCSSQNPEIYKGREYSVLLPDGWQKKLEWGIFGDLTAVVEPNKDASITFYTIEGATNHTLEEFMKESLEHLRLRLEEKGEASIDGRKAIWFKAAGREQVILEYLVRRPDKIYVIMGSTVPGDYEKYKNIFKSTAYSFKFERS